MTDDVLRHQYTDVQLNTFRDRYAAPGEQFPHEAWGRVANAVGRDERERKDFRKLLSDFRYVPGGRILHAFGHESGATAMNCYVLPDPGDSREGILSSLREWVEIQALGGGVGINISSLRPNGSAVRNNGRSSGPVTWSKLFAFVTHDIIQQGGSRRGAAMIMMDCAHPDIMEFITAKSTPGVLEGCNMSVCISDAFMLAVKNDFAWNLQWNGKLHSVVQARDIWNAICESAWKSGEPGIYFMERANKARNGIYFEPEFRATNPCGEQALSEYAACLLGSVNLKALLRDNYDSGYRAASLWFDFSDLVDVVTAAVRFNDNIIDLSNYPLPECEASQKLIRRMGIGVMGLADVLIALGLRYGSPEAVTFTAQVYETIAEAAYSASAILAKERGSFPAFTGAFLDSPFVRQLSSATRKLIAQHGIRNCYLTTQAPTGTTSLLAGVNGGIEPYFAFEYERRDRVGEYIVSTAERAWAEDYRKNGPHDALVIANDVTPKEHVDMQAAAQLWIDSSISKTVNAPEDYTVEQVQELYMYAYDSGLKSVTVYRDKSRDVQVLNHLEDAPKKVKKAKKRDLAAFAEIWNDASPAPIELAPAPAPAPASVRRRLPDTRESITHKFSIGEHEGYITVGFYPGTRTPGEVFVTLSKEGSTLAGLVDALVTMISISLQSGVPLRTIVSKLSGSRFEPAGMTTNPNIRTTTSLVDYIVRFVESVSGNAAPLQTFVAGLDPAADGGDVFAWTQTISMSGELCACGQILIPQEGCLKCLACGYSRC